MNKLNVYKVNSEVSIPEKQTSGSACFDLAYQPNGKSSVIVYTHANKSLQRKIDAFTGAVSVAPDERIMLPTGLIFDVPEGYSIRVHSRSGISVKNGLVLVNGEGIVDSDYVEETFILLCNLSATTHIFRPGDRIAQAELVKVEEITIHETKQQPTQKTNRAGGFGSTGTQTFSKRKKAVKRKAAATKKKIKRKSLKRTKD